MHVARQAARDAKNLYDQAVLRRSSSQREVNDLLQRKSSWTEDDVLRFTRLVREDHVVEQEEARAKALALQSDDDVDKQFNELMRSILSRYHEEQAWSDKIRSASTYGSLLALGLNMVVFISAIVVVEPWKRKRMVQSFETTVIGMHEEMKKLVDDRMEGLISRHETLQKAIDDKQNQQNDASLHEAEDVLVSPVESEAPYTTSMDWNTIRQLPVPISALAFVGAGAVGWTLRAWVG
jgi:sensitive to high expression protein 9